MTAGAFPWRRDWDGLRRDGEERLPYGVERCVLVDRWRDEERRRWRSASRSLCVRRSRRSWRSSSSWRRRSFSLLSLFFTLADFSLCLLLFSLSLESVWPACWS